MAESWNDLRKAFLLLNVVGSTTYWTLNDLEKSYAGGGDWVPPSPLTNVNTIWLYGASIEDGICMGTALGATNAALSGYVSHAVGRTISVVNKGVSGQDLAAIKTRFDAEAAAATALGDQLLIITMPMGNDITAEHPYPGGSTLIGDGMEDLLLAMMATGAHVMPVNTTFRDYAPGSVNDESNGSKPYNDNVLLPLALANTPSMVYSDGALWHDPYNIARNWYSLLLIDEVHYSTVGYLILGRYWLDAAASRILAGTAPRVPRVSNPTLDQVPGPCPCGFYVTTGDIRGLSEAVYGFAYRGVFNIGVDQPCFPLADYDATSITITNYSWGGGAALNSTNLNTGNTSPTLFNDEALKVTIPVDSTTWFKVCDWNGLNPGQSVRVDFTAARYVAAGAADRVGDYSLDGGSTFVSFNGAVQNAGQVVLHSVTGVADGTGKVSLYMRRQVASQFAYLNGAILNPL